MEAIVKYERFEQLPVWQAAIDLARNVDALTEKPSFRPRYSLRDRIERAAVSVSNNIAEGIKRGAKPEFLTFSTSHVARPGKRGRCCACFRKFRCLLN
jgi:hypothetical protein